MAVIGKQESDKLCNLIYALEQILGLRVSFEEKPFEYKNARLPIGADIVT